MKKAGFTLIELLVVILIMGMLTTIVIVNFQAQRQSQEIEAARQDVLSRLRQSQSDLLGGRILSGETAAAASYEMTFTTGRNTYQIDYFIGTNRKAFETMKTLQNTQIQQILVAGSSRSQVVLRFTAPYGAITADGAANQTVQIQLAHAKSGRTKTVVIDGVSGRIGAQ